MLLKCSRASTVPCKGKGKGKLTRGGTVMRMTMSTGSTMSSRVHRKVLRIPSKRHPGKAISDKLHSMARTSTGKIQPGKRIAQTRSTPAHCDNSNDSGLGFDHHVETPFNASVRQMPSTRFEPKAEPYDNVVEKCNEDFITPPKRIKHENKLDIDDTCSNDAFIFTQQQKGVNNSTSNSLKLVSPSTLVRSSPRPTVRRPGGLVTPQSQIGSVSSKDGKFQLQILAQPEQQHRARYQTEGSRGAVKDRSGNGFPVVKLSGYNKPAILEIFIGTDIGRVAPHMFYQACKVSGKNSTPCVETKLEGTIVIEIELKPETDMTATCDCVGILKERNVDVEHRFPDHSGPRSKKKSTRCRMVFRTQLLNDDGTTETLQICSQQIICTQPPGVPEICKKSLSSCPATGGLELFIIGKNFLKDTRVIFQARRSSSPNRGDGYEIVWEESVQPDKEFLQQTHLICTVPPYINPETSEPVTVQLFVTSSNKKSESHNFLYTPKGVHNLIISNTSRNSVQNSIHSNNQEIRYTDETTNPSCPLMIWSPTIEPINELDSGMMPPPSTLPLNVRRPSSAGNMVTDQISPTLLKSEIIDENSQGSLPDSDRISNSNENSMDGTPIKDMQYVQQRLQKHSIDIMESTSIMVNNNSVDMLMHDTNSMNGFSSHDNRLNLLQIDNSPEMKVVDLRVKQEQLAAQIQQYVNNENESQLLSVVQAEQSVNKFLSNLESNVDVNNLNSQSVAVALYANTNSNNNNDVIFNQEISNLNNQINASINTKIDQSFAHNLMTDPGSSTSINHILNYSTNTSNGTIIDPSNSPHSQDVILNSQPAASLNTTNGMSLMTSSTGTQSGLNMSSDIILNPSVSPTMMCQSNNDATNNLTPAQVTSVLTCHAIQTQNSQNTLMNNLMQPIMSTSDSIHIPRTSPVAVKNMILNAAADILSSQPSSISAETTINALISLNSNSMLNDTQSTVSQMLITQAPSDSSNACLMSRNEHSRLTEALCHNPQTTLNEHIFTAPTVITSNQMLPNSELSQNNANILSISNMVSPQQLMNEEIRNDQLRRAQHEFLNDYQNNMHKINTNIQQGLSDVTQESLLQAVSLVRNDLSKPKNDHVSDMQLQTNGMGGGIQQPTAANIPQEITIMSDNDLISYINPSCFDQV